MNKSHCNKCNGLTNHQVLHTETTSWEDENTPVYGRDSYHTLKCLGCDTIQLKLVSMFSEREEDIVTCFPPTTFRREPSWFSDLWLELRKDEEFVETLLKEIYVALQNNLPSLAAMGVRSLLEKVMISKTGDKGSFFKNINEFESMGYVSRIQKERLESILDAGHATIHRNFMPCRADIITLVELTEHIIETVYLHEDKVNSLKNRVPTRKITTRTKAKK